MAAVDQVLGLNAQDPDLPYLALWSRLRGFAIEDLTGAIEDGSLVRSTLMRATQHVLSAPDFGLVRPLLAALLQRVQRNTVGTRTAGVDLDALVAETYELLADGRVLTRPELGRLLARSRPGADPNALGWSVQYLFPVVHPAPSGTWNTRGPTPFARADRLPPPTAEQAIRLVRRYLA
ncbi:MAG: DNA glycosylase AlkZ-like family protein, partial [Pseudonocardia sp.]